MKLGFEVRSTRWALLCFVWGLAQPAAAGAQAGEEWEWPSDAVMQTHLDSLFSVATSAAEVDARRRAIVGIFDIGSISAVLPGEPYKGVVRRLRDLYEREPTEGLRSYIVRRMSDLGEADEQIAFFRAVATEERGDEGLVAFPTPAIAIAKLAGMGEAGRAVLRELAAQGSVRSSRARALLSKLEGQTWRP